MNSGIEGNVITLNACVNSCESAGEWCKVLMELGQMQEVGLKISSPTLTSAVNAAANRTCWARAISFLEHSSDLYDLIFLNSAVCAYGAGLEWKLAQSFLRTMRDLRSYDKARDSGLYKAAPWRLGSLHSVVIACRGQPQCSDLLV